MHCTNGTDAQSFGTNESTSGEFYDSFEHGFSIDDAANQLDRTVDTVSKYHGGVYQGHPISDLAAWIPANVQKQVEQAIGQMGCERLKPVFEHLDSQIDYAKIRIVAIFWEIRQAEEVEDQLWLQCAFEIFMRPLADLS